MNTLEQLKRAKEGEPVAVIVVGDMPKHCFNCKLMAERLAHGPQCIFTREDVRSDGRLPDCPIKKAIALVEPNGHLIYLGEEEQ